MHGRIEGKQKNRYETELVPKTVQLRYPRAALGCLRTGYNAMGPHIYAALVANRSFLPLPRLLNARNTRRRGASPTSYRRDN